MADAATGSAKTVTTTVGKVFTGVGIAFSAIGIGVDIISAGIAINDLRKGSIKVTEYLKKVAKELGKEMDVVLTIHERLTKTATSPEVAISYPH